MASFRHSVVFRMAVGYGLLLLFSVALISTVFYIGTAGLISRNIDAQLTATSRRLIEIRNQSGQAALEREVHLLLTDDRDVDTEVYLLTDAQGRKIIGNITVWSDLGRYSDELVKQQVKRLGHDSVSRLLIYRFADGSDLVVGRDMRDQRELERMSITALSLGGLMALVLAALGAWLFRRQLKNQLNAIHLTTTEVSAGNLDKRIEVGRSQDEFAMVAHDVNVMLDEIERLMETARDVSNAIAHDLRTPLSRIRSKLEDALNLHSSSDRLPASAQYAIDEIDAVTAVLDKLLQIAEAESGVRRQHFVSLPLGDVVADIVELYQPAAENQGQTITLAIETSLSASIDRDLMASVMANLLDNALKYAGPGTQIQVRVTDEPEHICLVIEDNGPGIPPKLIGRATERFFRMDASRHLRGNGLGLSIVAAVVSLHRGKMVLEDVAPGLRVHIRLPRD
jgi:signal transduction histidine kinase